MKHPFHVDCRPGLGVTVVRKPVPQVVRGLGGGGVLKPRISHAWTTGAPRRGAAGDGRTDPPRLTPDLPEHAGGRHAKSTEVESRDGRLTAARDRGAPINVSAGALAASAHRVTTLLPAATRPTSNR